MFNERPVDQKWMDLADELAEAAATDLQSLIVMVAAQEGGKLGIAIGGKGLPGEEIATWRRMADQDIVVFLRKLAECIEFVEAHVGEPAPPMPSGPKEVLFEPGCFDAFDGSPEELQDLIAQIHQSAADGTMFKDAKRLSPEEQEDVDRRIAEAAKRRARPQ